MKKCRKIMAFVAVVLAFAMVFTNVSVPAEAATTSVKSISVTNLPSNTLTLKAGKTFALKTNVAASKLKFATSNSRIATVTSKGTIKAVKSGKANITISLKTNATVKKVISVTVGRPVTGVKLNRTTLTLVKGKSAVFRTTVTPANASNKKLVWKSSNTAVLKVSTTGKITGVKTGVATITATAADGSSKKAVCKVTVVNPTRVTSVSMTDPLTAKVVLSQAQKLTVSNFSAKAGTVLNGTFPISVKIDSVTTKDNKTYILKFNKKRQLDNQVKVRITVSGLYGTGTTSVERSSTHGIKKELSSVLYTCKQNVMTAQSMELDPDGGYYRYTVKNLPTGIKFTTDSKDNYKCFFVGTPTKISSPVSTLTAKDEMGNVYIVRIMWNIYNDSTIAASYQTGYYNIDYGVTSVGVKSKVWKVSGGSGSYTYAIVGDNYGLSIDSAGTISGTMSKPGTYTVRVKVSDANNPSLNRTVNCVIAVSKEISVAGTIKTKNGKTVNDAKLMFTNDDNSSGFAIDYKSTYTDQYGHYQVSLPAGTYDVTISFKNDETYIYSQTLKTTVLNKNFALDANAITVKVNTTVCDADNFGVWHDEYGNEYGTGDTLYLTPGTYKLSAMTSRVDSFNKMAVITATVTSKTTSLTAKVYSRTVSITEGKGVTTYVDRFYKFVPKTSGTYYFYSVSYNREPCAFLYDGDTDKMLTFKNGGGHGLSDNKNDFCMSYECEAGKAYLIEVSRSSCTLYVSSVAP